MSNVENDCGLTHQEAKDILDYDPLTGVRRWKFFSRTHEYMGVAGSLQPDGYRRIKYKRRQYLAHRLVWFYVNGVWPQGDIDHINRSRSDNRISNLREATRSQNVFNSDNSRNTSGFRGVHYAKKQGNWIAQIKVDGKGMHLGSFDTPEQASLAYQKAAGEHFFDFMPNGVKH